MEAIEAELGTNPKGGSADVKSRIAATETVANAAAAKASNLSDLTSASSAARTSASALRPPPRGLGDGDRHRNGSGRRLGFVIDGGGSALTTGMKGYRGSVRLHDHGATLLADQSGSVVVDVFRSTYSDFAPPTHPVSGDKLTASAPPTISTATKSQDATLTGWTTSLAAGDVLGFNVNSATTITRVTCSLKVTRT